MTDQEDPATTADISDTKKNKKRKYKNLLNVKSGKTYVWENQKKTKIVIGTDDVVKSNERGWQSETKNKFLFRLKLPPKDISETKKRKFLRTLLKTVRYNDCLCIELDDSLVPILWSELKITKKTCIGIREGSKIELYTRNRYTISFQPEPKNEVNKLAYSYFNKLILADSVSEFKISQETKNQRIYICEITLDDIEESNQSLNQNTSSSGLKDDLDNDLDSESDNDSDSDSERDSDNDTDSDLECNDDYDDDDEEEDEEECKVDDKNDSTNTGIKTKSGIESQAELQQNSPNKPDTDSEAADHGCVNTESVGINIAPEDIVELRPKQQPQVAKLSIKMQQNQGSRETESEYFSFKDACHVKKLRSKLYQIVTSTYQLDDKEKDAFYLRMTLGILNETILKNWVENDLYEIINICIKRHEAHYMHELHNQYKPYKDVKDVFKKITKMFFEKRSRLNKSFSPLEKARIEYDHDKDKPDSYFYLFMYAIKKSKFKASLIYWTKCKKLIPMSLVASYAIKRKMKREKNQFNLKKLKRYAETYEKYSTDLLTKCYKEDLLLTWKLLTQKIPRWEESCITIALKTDNMAFTQHEACADLITYVWETFQAQEDIFDVYDNFLYNLKETFFSPKARCFMDMVAYLLFLTAYSVLIVTQLSARTFNWLEAVVMTYILVFLIKECDQHYKSRYILNYYNILDHVGIAGAVIAWSLRWVAYNYPDNHKWMYASRYFFSFDFMLYMFRFLQFFYMNKFYGPIIVMMKQMVRTYIPFLLILLLYWATYSVASESLIYPETELNSKTLYYVFRKGFWAMIGEYSLDELEVDEDECTRDPDLYNNHTMLRCPEKYAKYFVPIMLGIYAISIQILIFSLIIALINNHVISNDTKRDMIWSLQKCNLTSEYAQTRFLIPPFSVLFFWIKPEDPFILESRQEDMILLKSFELCEAQPIIREIGDKLVKKVAKKKANKVSGMNDLVQAIQEMKKSLKEISRKTTEDPYQNKRSTNTSPEEEHTQFHSYSTSTSSTTNYITFNSVINSTRRRSNSLV